MAKRKARSTADDWKGFVNYHLPNDIKKAAAEFRESWDLLGNIIPTLVLNRYKLSVSYNPKDDAVIASVTCKDPQHHNYQRTLTAFGPDVQESLLRLCYIHFVVFDEDWPEDGGKQDDGW